MRRGVGRVDLEQGKNRRTRGNTGKKETGGPEIRKVNHVRKKVKSWSSRRTSGRRQSSNFEARSIADSGGVKEGLRAKLKGKEHEAGRKRINRQKKDLEIR